jgi:hypothetical protein
MSKSRIPLLLGVAAAGGIGYYLYTAGGDPKAAEKKFESTPPHHSSPNLPSVAFPLGRRSWLRQTGDVHKASASVKAQMSGLSPEPEKEVSTFGAKAGAKIDGAVSVSLPQCQQWLCLVVADKFVSWLPIPPQISEADKQVSRAKSNAEAYAKEARAGAIKKIDELDKKVEEASAKAKGGISSWFGGK